MIFRRDLERTLQGLVVKASQLIYHRQEDCDRFFTWLDVPIPPRSFGSFLRTNISPRTNSAAVRVAGRNHDEIPLLVQQLKNTVSFLNIFSAWWC